MAEPHQSLRSIYERALREEQRALIGWATGLAVFSVVMLAIFPTISGNESFSKLLEAYPESLRKLFDVTDYTTGPGYLRSEVFSFMAPLLVAIFAIIWGSDLVAGEEDRGTIDALLSNPVSRRRFVVEKWAALVSGVLLLSAMLELTLGLLGPAFKLHIGWAPLSAAVLGLALVAISCGSIAFAIGAATGSRALARGIGAALAVASYLLSSLPSLVSWLRPVRPVSLWYHALGTDPLVTGFHMGHLGVDLLITLLAVLVAVVAFERRDLAV